jgi:hypothetical protein
VHLKNNTIEQKMSRVSEMSPDYLRRQAETCLRLARTTFDLATAERLRYMAADFNAKADELEGEDSFTPHYMRGNGNGSMEGESDRG